LDETIRHSPKSETKASMTVVVVPFVGGTGLVPPGELAKADPVAVARRAAVSAKVRILRVMVETPGAGSAITNVTKVRLRRKGGLPR
jgi:hypothetical protein